MLVPRAQMRTLERIARRPGVLEAHLTNLSFDIDGCCASGLVERRGGRTPGAAVALYLTPRGRAALARKGRPTPSAGD